MAIHAVVASGAVRGGDHLVGVAAIVFVISAMCWDAYPFIASRFRRLARNKPRRD
ncbi:hypothetical protein [Sphingomonas sp. PR090111-T3T-6A]|uniref:hypothetical protein n=1 Tax=Sphingomonas sp. PR090111-T3T-6A TaxID=685778 RepID=UPI0003668459|nr:hypothetical protein [Sphingomonas sp. PR090111-T3T-6A]